MNYFLVHEAWKAYKEGRLKEALDLFKSASKKIGLQNFKANIIIIQNKLNNNYENYSLDNIFNETTFTIDTIEQTSIPCFKIADDCRKFLKERPHDFAIWLKNLRIAVIMDEFTWQSYSPEANMLQLTPTNWHNELETFRPDLLFVESAWRGKEDLWKNTIHKNPPELINILKWCKEHLVPTAFWNKEDPIHFETFINIASLFNFVFTYDFHCVPRYKSILKHNNIYYLPMGVQPNMFNPIEKYKRKNAICFAGSYYKQYPERTKDLEEYLTNLSIFKPIEIYDREYGTQDENYKFPDKYKHLIKGHLAYSEIDKAYKGYIYSINLNSIKQANSIARRVYELMACNTLIISNFSRGIQCQMGELTILSDNTKEIIRRIKEIETQPFGAEMLRLVALRKVMSESTYQDRLAYIISKICNITLPTLLPFVYVIAHVDTIEQAKDIYDNYVHQNYNAKHLLLISNIPLDFLYNANGVSIIHVANFSNILNTLPEHAWLTCFAAEDFYGKNYLTDIMLATRYVHSKIIGKSNYYSYSDGSVCVRSDKNSNSYVELKKSFQARRAIAQVALLKQKHWKFEGKDSVFPEIICFSIDKFNYLENGIKAKTIHKISICDKDNIDIGISVTKMQEYAERAHPLIQDDTTIQSLKNKLLYEEFTAKKPSNKIITSLIKGNIFHISSTLSSDKHEYIYGKTYFPIKEITKSQDKLKLHLMTSRNMNLSLACIFLNKYKKRLQSPIVKPNINIEIPICNDAIYINFALRVQGSGETDISTLFFDHCSLEPEQILGIEETLVLTNCYPSYNDLYRNAFVHSRVRAYRQKGLKVSVYQFSTHQKLHFDEFEGITVFRGGASALRKIITENKVHQILVHFLNIEMWEVLKDIPLDIRIIAWLHGAEIQPWTRRIYNYTTDKELEKAKIQSDIRMAFWKKLFNKLPNNIHFIFVSNYFANEVMKDTQINIPKNRYSIIHNPIDTNIFCYHKKNKEHRYKLLSIRPFASRKYANDLTVKCILKLAERKDFDRFMITIVGNGCLFDEIVKPIEHMKNVKLMKMFLTHAEIVSLHREHGIFIVPTRMDAQGVSRDEAMASGLVPVTNAVTAIPEFVDNTCGILAPAEDAEAMAVGISRLVDNPELFLSMSQAAAERVRRQSSADIIIERELNLIIGEDKRRRLLIEKLY